ncbi:hypothetical protein [Solemya velum gill symbiont]|uniref:hypothetical protein n=1 Tax=Solemya velum gill symbiont TaxID=2340 RepID=UPI00117B42EF|nr:hypothetical protein [Solemya velum gill symbiont]
MQRLLRRPARLRGLYRFNLLWIAAFIILLAASTSALAAPAPKQLVPMTADLVRATRDTLQQGAGVDEEHSGYNKRALDILRRNGLTNWGGSSRGMQGLERVNGDKPISHTIMGFEQGQQIHITWNPEQNSFEIRIKDYGRKDQPPFEIRLSGTVHEEVDEDGKLVRRSVRPSDTPVKSLSAQEIRVEAEQLFQSLLGKWKDQDGNLWTISGKFYDYQESVVKLEQLFPDGEVLTWNGLFQSGTIRAKRKATHLHDTKETLPMAVRRQLITKWQPNLSLELRLRDTPEDRLLEGEYQTWLVTYDSDENTVSRVHTERFKSRLLTRIPDHPRYTIDKFEITARGLHFDINNLKKLITEKNSHNDSSQKHFNLPSFKQRLDALVQKRDALYNKIERLRKREKSDEFWSLQKELTPIEGEINNMESRLYSHLNDTDNRRREIADLQDKLDHLEARKKPLLDTIILHDESGVPISEWKKWVPVEDINRRDSEIIRLKGKLRELGQIKKEATRRFTDAVDSTSEALDAVSKSIWKSAQRQAVIESGYYLWDVVQGWKKGGPAGALSTAMKTAVESFLFDGEYGFDFAEADADKIRREVEEDFHYTPEKFGLDPGTATRQAYERALKENFSRNAHETLDKHITTRVSKFLSDRLEGDMLRGIRNELPIKVLEKRSEKVVRYNRHVDNLKAGFNAKNVSGNLLKGLAQDLTKELLKDLSEREVARDLTTYFQLEILRRVAFSAYDKALKQYDEIENQLRIRTRTQAILIDKYDPDSGFRRTSGPGIVEEGNHYSISLKLLNIPDRRAKVKLGTREALLKGPAGEKHYSVQVIKLNGYEPISEHMDFVTLKIDFLD